MYSIIQKQENEKYYNSRHTTIIQNISQYIIEIPACKHPYNSNKINRSRKQNLSWQISTSAIKLPTKIFTNLKKRERTHFLSRRKNITPLERLGNIAKRQQLNWSSTFEKTPKKERNERKILSSNKREIYFPPSFEKILFFQMQIYYYYYLRWGYNSPSEFFFPFLYIFLHILRAGQRCF